MNTIMNEDIAHALEKIHMEFKARKLTKKERTFLFLWFGQGYSNGTIAKHMNLEYDQYVKIRAKALKKLTD